MSLALSTSSYPLLNIFWTLLEFFLWVIWIWILIMVLIDIFRSHDLSGWAKALWVLFVLLIPLIGVVVYLIVRGGEMHERAARQALHQEQLMREYARQHGGGQHNGGQHGGPGSAASSADELAKLADLKDRGVISPEEFDREKAKVLA